MKEKPIGSLQSKAKKPDKNTTSARKTASKKPTAKSKSTAKPGNKALTNRLQPQHKLFICHQLAVGLPVGEIINQLYNNYGVTIERSSIYDTYIGKPRWKRIVRHLRRKIYSKVTEITAATKEGRLNVIDRLIKRAEEKGDYTRVIELLQIARVEVEGERPVNARFQIGDNRTQLFQGTDAKTDGQMDEGRLLNDTINRISSYIKG